MMFKKMLLAAGGLFTVSSATPNFMIFMADDQQFYFDESPPPRYDGVAPTLTAMNRVRDEGAVFLRAYAASTMCAPSRFALLTGRYASRGEYAIDLAQSKNGNDPTWNGRVGVSVPSSKITGADHQRTTAKTLSDNGYRTIHAGKWHLATNDINWQSDYPALVSRVKESGFTDAVAVYHSNMNQGNKASDGTVYGHNLEWMVESTLNVVEDAVINKQNFYLYFAPTAPHGPSPYDDMFLDERATPSGWLPQTPVTTMKSRSVIRAEGNDDPAIVSHLWVDESLAALMEGLNDLKVLDTTMIILCMDHGMGAKNQIYEGGARILQAVRYPPLAIPGTVISSVVSNIDISATITDIAGLIPSYQVDGRSWKNDLQGNPSSVTVPKVIELGTDRAVIADRFKFFSLDAQSTRTNLLGVHPHINDCIQLYDVVTDGGEQLNLVGDASYNNEVTDYSDFIKRHDEGTQMPEVQNSQLLVANFGNTQTVPGNKVGKQETTCTTVLWSCEVFTSRRSCSAATCPGTGSACVWSRRTCSC